MKKLLVIGAGRSASTMIKYLLDNAEKEDWKIKIADFNYELALEKVGNHPRGIAIAFNATDPVQRELEVAWADLVISLLPFDMHVPVARDCVKLKTHLITASYVSDEMAQLNEAAWEADVILMNELGADPGIDHLSGMEMADRIRQKGGIITAFRSYCGALVAPESNNLWGYKFTWAPRNIILSGQGGMARYMKKGAVRYIPYYRLFDQVDQLHFPGIGDFEAYANRDSLKYRIPYGMEKVPTMYRATIRNVGYCHTWSALVRIGLTDDTFAIHNASDMSWSDFVFSFISEKSGLSREQSLAAFLGLSENHPVVEKLLALGLLSDQKVGANGTPAQILQNLLEDKWRFLQDDVDMLLMQHQIDFQLNGREERLVSSMVVKGESHLHTAISKTVGLPAAIGAKLILSGKIPQRGVQIPTFRELYLPLLDELETFGIKFEEEEIILAEKIGQN